MTAKKPKNYFYVKLRTYAASKIAHVWLLRCDGQAQSWRLYGELLPDRAEEVATWFEGLGVPVEREESPFEIKEPVEAAKADFFGTT